MLIARFLLENAMRGFLLAMLYASGTLISLLLKFLEAVEIYDKLKEMNNDN